MKRFTASLLLLLVQTTNGHAASFKTNCCNVENAPEWLSSYTLSDIATEMESKLHWSIRRVKVVFHNTNQSFASASNLNFIAAAFFSPSRQAIEFSPQKDLAEFTPTFRHELVHVISNQKFKDSIPRWLEEGFANYIGSKRKVDYKWLAKQSLPKASQLSHPSTDDGGSKMHYQLSTATVEMIAGTCNFDDLLMLATGSKLTNYLETFCKIKDLDSSVAEWVVKKSK